MPEGVRTITAYGREGDMYELFAKARPLDEAFLTRIVQNRMTVENKRTLDGMRKKPRQGRAGVTISRGRRSRTGSGSTSTVCAVYDKESAYAQSR
ncbi:MAG: hypothetical protein LBG43_04995 [Treponema sp.]|jgi:hypothetical protein|nr:hypothetical protein [Treponema sp.]